MVYFKFKGWIYISIMNPFKTMRKLKGVFKSLFCYYKTSKSDFAPYPVLWVSKPLFIHIISSDVGWKDKYDTPRYEYPPYIWIHIYKWNFVWHWDLPDNLFFDSKNNVEDYWEQALWYLYYYNTYSQGLLDKPDIDKAKESWSWIDYNTRESTWNNKFLIK